MSAMGEDDAVCEHFQQAAELVGKRWNPLLVHAMRTGITRFSDIRDAVPGLSDHVLSQRLKELEAAGIVERTVTPSTPVCIAYRLTEGGEALAEVMVELATWAERWATVPEATAAPSRLPSEP
jgi:DNA-binding HxlR family transcriptional regulator